MNANTTTQAVIRLLDDTLQRLRADATRVFDSEELAQWLSRHEFAVELGRRVVQIYDNDCNSDMRSNGELRVIRHVVAQCRERPDAVVVDVGANVGDYAATLASCGFNGRLVCIDPLKRNLDQIRDRLRQAGFQHADLLECAVSDSAGRATLFSRVDQRHGGEDSLADMNDIGYAFDYNRVEVECRQLDEVVARLGILSIDLLKIDVEGAELAVLRSATGLLRRRAIHCIQFEFGHAARAHRVYLHDLVNFLRGFDYALHVVKPQGIVELEFTPFTENRYAYINLLAIRRESAAQFAALRAHGAP